MSLEPISFNKKDVTSKLGTISEIKKIIFEITGIEVQIKKLDPPKIVIVVDNSPAASELNLKKNMVLKSLEDYGIESIMIKTV
jgi:nitrate reductase NapAB chaperone NapD